MPFSNWCGSPASARSRRSSPTAPSARATTRVRPTPWGRGGGGAAGGAAALARVAARPPPPLAGPWRALDPSTRLDIRELAPEDSTALVRAVLRGEPPPELAVLVEKTQGNPFFIQ